MTGPAVVSIARIDPELARRSWGRVQRLVAGDGPGNASENLRCFIAVFRVVCGRGRNPTLRTVI